MLLKMDDAVKGYAEGIKEIYGSTVNRIVLYGSRARGDNGNNSDVDIFVLVDMGDDEIREKKTALADFTFEMEMEYGLEFSPVVVNRNIYDYWVDTLPFYNNIRNEGIVLYG